MLKLDLVMYVLWYYKPEGCWIQLESSQIDVGFPGGSDGKESAHEGEGGKIWENGIETCKISCMKWKKKKSS